MRATSKLIGGSLAAVVVLGVALATTVRPTLGQGAGEPKAKAAPGGEGVAAELVREELEVLRAQLATRKELLRIGEARLEQARRWRGHFEDLLQKGRVTEDRALAARDDVLMLEAHVAAERSEVQLAELKIKRAERRGAAGAGAARGDELEQRLEVLEMKVDGLQHEVGRLRREIPHEM